MPPSIKKHKATLLFGDALKILPLLPSNQFQAIITSPPYWGLRDYNNKNQIGLENELDEYLTKLDIIFTHLIRLLKDDGVLWLNIGDCYTSGNRTYRAADKKNPNRAMSFRPKTPNGLKPKDLIGIPWHLAFLLQKKGWYLRTDIIWSKTNSMPESVKDRPTRNHEHLFLFSKSKKYFFKKSELINSDGAQLQSVWQFSTENGVKSHSATFPSEFIKPCILSSTKPGDFILDPFSGSGTVGVASLDLKRKYVGIEINKRFINYSHKAIPNSVLLNLSVNSKKK